MPLDAGLRLGAYEILGPIGAGGMGEVYRARDARLNRDVAIKVLPESFALDAERVARFTREAQTLAALNHPGIAAIYGIEESHGVRALVMELVEGEDLSAHISRGAIPLAEALPIARQIADALEAAHEQGIVHRDLKPANIKVRTDGTVKVLDFGLAKAMDPAASGAIAGGGMTLTSPAMTQAGVILGTAAYMAPEQARGTAVDKRADIWAFGMVLYEMLTGRRLFAGDTISDVIAAVLRQEPDLSPVPRQCRRLISRCLEKDPRRRLRDIGDAWSLLDSDESPIDTSRPRTRRVWPWALAALVVVALATWAAIAVTGRAAPQVPVAFVEPPPPGTRFLSAPIPSPDGRRLAFIAVDADDKSRLWMRELGDVSPRVIDGTDGATTAFWSPDSLQLAFVAQGQLRRAAAGGGPVSLIAAVGPRTGVWLPDDDILLALDGQGFMRVPATGGSPRPADGFTSEAFRNVNIDAIDVSADGRHVLFTQFGGATGIYVARLDGTASRVLYPGQNSAARFIGSDTIMRLGANLLLAQRFNPADMTLVGDSYPVAQNVGFNSFAGSASGAVSFVTGSREISRLTWFTRDGKAAGSGPEGDYDEVAISRGGRWLAFSRADPADGNVDIWLQALPGAAPSRLTSDPDVDHLLTISHDERDVAWEAHAKGTLNLVRRPVDGSAPATLVRPWGKSGGPVDWSPDGRFVLYHSEDGEGGSNLWAVPTEGSGEPVRLTQPGFGSAEGQFSPDGRWLAMTGKNTGGSEVYVQRLEGMKLVGGPIRVSENGGRWPQWRHDGAELFFINRGTLMATDFRGQNERVVDAPRSLFTVARCGPDSLRNYSATPDGQRFVVIVSASDPTPHPANVILNWRASVKP